MCTINLEEFKLKKKSDVKYYIEQKRFMSEKKLVEVVGSESVVEKYTLL